MPYKMSTEHQSLEEYTKRLEEDEDTFCDAMRVMFTSPACSLDGRPLPSIGELERSLAADTSFGGARSRQSKG